jgi:hypothetical protein
MQVSRSRGSVHSVNALRQRIAELQSAIRNPQSAIR